MSTPRRLLPTLLLVLLPAIVACGDDDGGAPVADAGPDRPADAMAVNQCEAFDTEHDELLNAPTDAVVIRKTPTHPPIGDAGLP